MKPFRKSRRIAKSQLANSKLKQAVNLILAIFLVSISSVDWVHAEFWFEDFTDGEISDSGIDWVFERDHSILPNGLQLSSPEKGRKVAVADWPSEREGWSIRTQGRLQQDHGIFGAGTVSFQNPGTWNAIFADGVAKLGNFQTGDESDYIETDLRPFNEDVILQLDTLDGVMRMWAWPADTQPEEDIAPIVEEPFPSPLAAPGIWAWSDDGPSSAFFRWVAISTEHMPVNTPVPLSDLIGDFSGDDVLDIADIDMLAAQIVSEPSNHLGFDLSGDGTIDGGDLMKWRTDAATHNGFGEPYLVGDSNLDGMVDAADLNNLALHWGDDVSRWSAGDFNADGRISALDLNGLAVNWGRSIPIAATANAPVPEPSALLLAIVGLTLTWGQTRRRQPELGV